MAQLSELGKSIGRELREKRKAANMSLKQLEALTGIDFSYISKIETGLTDPSIGNIERLCKGLGLRPSIVLTKSITSHSIEESEINSD